MNQTIVWGICLFEWNLAPGPFSWLKFSFARFVWLEPPGQAMFGGVGGGLDSEGSRDEKQLLHFGSNLNSFLPPGLVCFLTPQDNFQCWPKEQQKKVSSHSLSPCAWSPGLPHQIALIVILVAAVPPWQSLCPWQCPPSCPLAGMGSVASRLDSWICGSGA